MIEKEDEKVCDDEGSTDEDAEEDVDCEAEGSGVGVADEETEAV